MTLHRDVLAAAIRRASGTAERTALVEADAILDELARFGWRLTDVALPQEAKARTGARTTSRLAAETIDDMSARHAGVLQCLWEIGPATDGEIVARYQGLVERFGPDIYPPQSPASIRSRRAELVAAGHVRATGEQDLSEHGRPCNIWQAVA